MPQALDHSDPSHDGGARGTTTTCPVHIRHFRTYDEFVACLELQREVWGHDFTEQRPPAILKVCQRVGGIAAGAFDPEGQLVGFVFGITGVENGELVHWSDMLAVRPGLRDHGIGRQLKEFQRETVRRIGATRIYWTFDPLVARNAHLNLNRLGANVVEYVPDMYGAQTSSALHHGLGTDRFVVAWPIAGATPRSDDPAALPAAARTAHILNAVDGTGAPTTPELNGANPGSVFRVVIPLEIDRVQATSLRAAAQWRAATRRALQWGLQHGYGVRAFYRDRASTFGYYVLATTPLIGDP
jgi:predicted GNAT superfamily acetyltransferase